ncbi:hypothetical protein C8R44DRAFT_875362 [Mycena epipterygia]|nr:hypothetical protein C8R44DRAFT_875362 [Mycena epipterygia]
MKSLATSLLLLVVVLSPCLAQKTSRLGQKACRNVPGSAGYPPTAAWNAFNATLSGRLIEVVPSAKYCASLPEGACTDAQWASGLFRSTIPGAMDQINFEQGYDLTPPSLCLRNSTTCGQGDVPIYSVEAETVADIRAAASGHDALGRSTAPNSLLIRTTNFQNLTFTDDFFVGTQDMGSAVNVGSGVHSQTMYQQGKANGKAVLSAGAASVCTAGGYAQGAGHSALSPAFGLAADNALEFNIVVASGELLKVNSISYSDLFYALRGGGAGSWGIIVSATFRTFPIFNSTSSSIRLVAEDNTAAGALASVHAQHIFDLDPLRAGHSFSVSRNTTNAGSTVSLNANIPNTTTSQSMALLSPFINASLAIPGVSLISQEYIFGNINDALFEADDSAGGNGVLGSRLIPADIYRHFPATVGQVYKELLDNGTARIIAVVTGGGQVAENANISSAVHPAWRTAKTHLIIPNIWTDSASLGEIDVVRRQFQTQQLPILEQLSGSNAGSYSNEADVLEPDFKTTFFGPNYSKLTAIKRKYDPEDLFIVGAGVGSERWDEWGICKV